MKQIGLLFLLLITTSLQAQIQKMSELSQNKFLDAEIIYEDNGEEVWGYLLLYKTDEVSKEYLQLEYVILDKNLNKIGANTFNHDFYDSWIVDMFPNINSVYKNKNELLFAIGYDYDEVLTTNPYAFRKINLDDFTIGNTFFFIDNIKIEDNKVIDKLYAAKKDPLYFKPLKSGFFLSLDSNAKRTEHRSIDEIIFLKNNKKILGYSFYDINFNKLWTYKHDLNKKELEKHKYLNSNTDYTVFYVSNNNPFCKIIDNKTGNEIASLPIFDGKYYYNDSKVIFENENILFFDRIYENGNCIGYSKRIFDTKSKTVTDVKLFFWESISKFMEIDKKGKINKSDYLHFLDFRVTSEGKIIIIAEGYNMDVKNSNVKNIYTLELDSDFNLIYFNEIFKTPNKYDYINVTNSQSLEKYNLFDLMYSQKINNDEFIYFYSDKAAYNTKNKASSLGIIIYTDGKFSNQKIDLKTENGIINPIKAKKGYIILQEVNDKGENTIRLEKIDY